MFFFSIICLSLKAQEISFTFTANHTCTYAPLDSVLIENLTQGGDTTLYWNDTVMTVILTDIETHTTVYYDFYVSQNYPNPFKTQTQIDIFVPEQDIFTINIFDITGRKVISSENTLGQGLHNFTFYAGNSNNYIFVVNSTKYLQQILMVQVSSLSKSAPVLEYPKNISALEVPTKQKSLKSYFPYAIGDELKFTGFVGGDFTEITDNPNNNEDYIFDIADLVPEQPSPIIGESSICEQDTGLIYSVEHTEHVIFEWTVPDDWEIISGQGTNSITVDAGISGNISVFCWNNCGNSPERVVQVTVNPYPEPEITSSSDDMCVGETRLLTATPPAGVFSILSGHATIDGNELTANQSGSIIEADTVIIQYEITINGCTGFSTQDIIVNQNPIATINGATEACDIVTLTASGGLSYMWSGGSSFNSAENSFIESGTYSVTVIDENECTDVAYADVIVKFAPTAPNEAQHFPSEYEIIWNWNSTTIGANYKYNIFNQYGTAFDNGTNTTYTQEGLQCGTEYSLYVWAYNECGPSEVLFLTQETVNPNHSFACGDTYVDCRDNNVYQTVQISDQCWMAENLKYLPSVVGPGTGSTTIPYYYVYGYYGTNATEAKATSNYSNYGVLYNWIAAMNSSASSSENPSGVQGACPPGWHLPSDDEWTELVDYIVSLGHINNQGYHNGAGNALKSCRQVDSPIGGNCETSEHPRWNSYDTHSGFDEFSFSALPGGKRDINNSFDFIGHTGIWWSATKCNYTDIALYRFMRHDYGSIGRFSFHEDFGFSVRCVKD